MVHGSAPVVLFSEELVGLLWILTQTQNPPPTDVVPSGGDLAAVSAPSDPVASTSGKPSGLCILRTGKPVTQGSRSRPAKDLSLPGSDSTSAKESAEEIRVVRPAGSKFFRPGVPTLSDSDFPSGGSDGVRRR